MSYQPRTISVKTLNWLAVALAALVIGIGVVAFLFA